MLYELEALQQMPAARKPHGRCRATTCWWESIIYVL
jgi:hypothetical protein